MQTSLPRASSAPGPPRSDDTSSSTAAPNSTIPEYKVKRFYKILGEDVVDVEALRQLAWGGVPSELRPVCWRLLLGYLPAAKNRQESTLARKRHEYMHMIPHYYDIPNSERSAEEVAALRQVMVDTPRTAPGVPFVHCPSIQHSLERMLYIWGIRHPASGYVQGMNDLATPFYAVFLSEHLQGPMDDWQPDEMPQDVLKNIEADCYWCLCKLLECIQDHYTYAQPGIQRSVFRVRELVSRMNSGLASHLAAQSVDFLQFSFRWVNCLLLRELPFRLAVRLWDTYVAEGPGIGEFLVYVCAAFLDCWSPQLMALEFQELVYFLQRLPTAEWDERQVESVLAVSHSWRSMPAEQAGK